MKLFPQTVVVVTLLTFAGPSHSVWSAGDCDDNCFAPRSWITDFEEDVLVAAPDDWQRRNGTSAQPTYVDGKGIFDGTQAAWTLFDSADHYFVGTTTVRVAMDENPGGPNDRGAGWWINMDNEAIQGGFFPIYGVLARNGTGQQVYRFGQSSSAALEEIVIADGPMEANIFLLPPEDGQGGMGVAYSITDGADQVFDGFIEVPGRDGAKTDDKWLTAFSMADGQGVFDYLEVHNQPSESAACDFDNNGTCDLSDIDALTGEGEAGTNNTTYDLNADGLVNDADVGEWLTLAGQENGLAEPYLRGDANLDRIVNEEDLNKVGIAWNSNQVLWSEGNVVVSANEPGVNAPDLNAVGANWQSEVALAAANTAAVPEPAGLLPLLAALFAVWQRQRRTIQ